MQAKNYWVGDRPLGSWVFTILDQTSGAVQDLTGYTSATILMLDPRNQTIDIDAANCFISNASAGQVTFVWPQDSVFTRPGRYVVQVQIDGPNASRRTTTQEILVSKLGGVSN